MDSPFISSLGKRLVYPVRTTLAAVLALLGAKALGLPEYFWAPVSAVVVTQSDLGSSLTMSWHRLVGTALGVVVGAFVAEDLGRGVLVYALGLAGLALLSALLRFERPASRFAAIAFTIVLLIVRSQPAWVVALHRFIEVSMGIVAGLVLTAVWPEQQPAESAPPNSKK
jgi:uncharacterized membrane protein YgaE (UPF0421/DUF939 family)